MVKKFGYKTPTIVALTLAGTAFSGHQANAAEQVAPEKTPTNVLDDQYALKQADDAKQTTQGTTLAGSKEYKDPSQIDTAQVDTAAQTETPVEEGQQDAQQPATTDEATSTDHNTVSKSTDESASPATASIDEGTLNAQANSDETASNHTQDATEDATKYPYRSSEVDTHEDATVSPDTYQAPDTPAQQPSATDISYSTTAQTEATQANTSTNVNNKEAVAATEYAATTQPQAAVQSEAKATKETAQNKTPQVDTKDTAQVDSKVTATQNTTQSAATNQDNTDKVAKRALLTNETKTDATTAKTEAPASATRQADTQAKTTTDKKATTYSAQTATDKDINANPDGPTPPRVGGKGGPPASLSLQSTGQTAFRSAVASKPSAYQPKVKSSINDYIRKQNYKVPVYEEDYSSYFPKYGYRNGVGKPEGIIVHDTANDRSTIDGEISYMKRNYQNAFVHGFINGQRIIETQPTDYLAWGAGAIANERFIHIELVHVHSKEDFARQMNNMADYAATNLQYYGLAPDSAEYDGRGTVWTHDAVSRFLGGTDHTDPHGYLKQHGYSYDELYDLINEKYQVKMGYASPANSSSKPSTNTALKVTTDTGLGRIKDKNSGLYATVYDKTGKSTSATNQTLKVTKKASLNGQSFYLVTDYATGTYVGWAKQADVEYQTSKAPSKVSQNYTIKSGAKLYQVPWGTSKQVAGTVTGAATQTFKTTLSQTVGKATYLYGTVGKLSGWINSTALTVQKAAASSVTKAVSQIGQLNTKNSGIKASIYDKTAKSAARWAGQTYKITKTASANNEDYVLLQNNTGGTPLGWFYAKDVTTHSLGAETAIKGNYTVNSKTSGLYAMPWGTTKQRVDTLKNAASRLFTASKSVKVGNDTFLFGIVNQKLGWINQKDLTAVAAKVANIKTASNSAVKGAAITTLKKVEDYVITNKNGYYYTKVGDSKSAGALKGFYQQLFKVEKSSLLNGITWYYGAFQNGTKGWIKAADVRSSFIQHTAVSSTLKAALDKQMALTYPPQVQRVAGKWVNANRAETEKAMNTAALEKDPTLMYQFLKLDQYQGLGAEELNKLLRGKGILEGQGAAFKEAAQKHNINEVYLMSHAFLETGNGTSQLANGGHVDKNNKVVTTGKPKYYNMFGIGAIDTDALRNGFKTAERYGWNTVSKAIIGGAKFIRDQYIGSGQNTLYRMRWNPEHPATHQYATDINWANVNAQRMKYFYDQIGETGKYFDVDVYKK
ncbi:glucosaminidase domain-containing protein [Staphylococcus delphini]|uniref:glucosaminidase domain-containing protein n=1 Tax=Staphylococcus delphini TaxID=53344 RepID=UPI0021D3A6A5|nr:glucosaminidase domain-containing protein [Staphylococcus delphini]UXS36288.1 glucosaminidase domain-containing protein [Staphylococcus delphini]